MKYMCSQDLIKCIGEYTNECCQIYQHKMWLDLGSWSQDLVKGFPDKSLIRIFGSACPESEYSDDLI
jgi:hypothetical protein